MQLMKINKRGLLEHTYISRNMCVKRVIMVLVAQ